MATVLARPLLPIGSTTLERVVGCGWSVTTYRLASGRYLVRGTVGAAEVSRVHYVPEGAAGVRAHVTDDVRRACLAEIARRESKARAKVSDC